MYFDWQINPYSISYVRIQLVLHSKSFLVVLTCTRLRQTALSPNVQVQPQTELEHVDFLF